MSGDTFDAQGKAQQALRSAVSSHGPGALSNPGVLGGLLPDSSGERNLVLTAAEAGVARELTKHVEQQRLDVGTAITMVAVALSSHRFIDIAGATWVTTEYARALGYSVPGAAPSPAQANMAAYQQTATIDRSGLSPQGAPFPAGQAPGAQPPVAPPPVARPPQASPPAYPPQPGYQQPPAYQPQPGYQGQPGYPAPPGSQQAGYQPPGGYQAQAGYQAQPGAAQPGYQPQGGYQPGYQGSSPPVPPSPQWPGPGQPGGPPGGRRSRRGLLIGGIGGGVAIVAIVVIAALAASSPSPKPTPVGSSGTAVAPTQSVGLTVPPGPASSAPASSTTAATSPTSSLAPGVTPVDQLLPSGINDTATQCEQAPQPLPFSAPGLVTAIRCADPNLPKGTVFGFQSDSAADYQTTFANYNKWLGFDAATAGTNCPPTGSNPQGVTEWKPDSQPSYSKSQVLECGTLGKGDAAQRVYIWSFPKDDAFLVAQASHATTFKTLDTWWTNN
jgi:hypothetical protein